MKGGGEGSVGTFAEALPGEVVSGLGCKATLLIRYAIDSIAERDLENRKYRSEQEQKNDKVEGGKERTYRQSLQV